MVEHHGEPHGLLRTALGKIGNAVWSLIVLFIIVAFVVIIILAAASGGPSLSGG